MHFKNLKKRGDKKEKSRDFGIKKHWILKLRFLNKKREKRTG
jgi:hypothetical protein